MKLPKEIESWLLNPPAESKAAAAREFGVDLTLTLANLCLTPQERMARLEDKLAFVTKLRTAEKRLPQSI
jgi:hypothetical protein